MSVLDNITYWLTDRIDEAVRKRMDIADKNREYRLGVQDKQLRVKLGQADDNLTVNYLGVIVDRSVALLFGKGITWQWPEEGGAQYDWLEDVWNSNNQEDLLHRLAIFGAEAGTCYLKLDSGKVISREDGVTELPRMVAVDPKWVTMDTLPDDKDIIIRYTIQYKTIGLDGKEVTKREIIEQDMENETGKWLITNYEASQATGGRFQQVGDVVVWEYGFSPMLHWQNLPLAHTTYGMPDLTTDVLAVQDRINFVASNISKIIRYHAHPQRVGKNITDTKVVEIGPDKMVNIFGSEADIYNLEMQTDLASSQEYLRFLVRAIMDMTRTVDVDSLADKLGQLTNFGLRVLYQDALQKMAVKRELYGDALVEVNRRLLMMINADYTEPGIILWADPLPQNQMEISSLNQTSIGLGYMSKQTAAEQQGLDWETEQNRMQEESAATNLENSNIGAALLQNFSRGV
jgi:hypothetical protein